jgi:ribonuclease BN (tRNA processing enzyme)
MGAITFLGTGGGRFVILSQQRYSGGLWLELEEATLILDPGPGALIRALQFGKNPEKLDGILVSHNHIDHQNDAGLMIEAMTGGMRHKRGVLALNNKTISYISEYHREFIDLIVASPGRSFKINNLEIEALPTAKHVDAVGFKFHSKEGTVTCTSDTAYSEDNIKHYKGSDILIMNTIVPATREIESHLNTKTAAYIVEKAKPKLAIMQHFGRTMLMYGPEKEAKWIQDRTGIRTLAAADGMTINLPELKEIGSESPQMKLDNFE